MSKVEEVARALATRQRDIDQAKAEASGHDVNLLVDAYLPWAGEIARAAIEAMREPTEAMLSNTVDDRGRMRIVEFTTVDERDKAFLMPRFTWRAMIDAALREEPKG